jgi:ABC-type transport system involved in cytochrome bd biosynthesis fused ATPase/permease subunit
MSTALVLLICAVACPVVMLLMMVLMRRGHASADRGTETKKDG